jgi:hypothetical protein
VVRLHGESQSGSGYNDGIESDDKDRMENGVSCSSSFPRVDFSASSSGGLSKMFSGVLPEPSIRLSSLELNPSMKSLLKSSAWYFRGSLRDSRIVQLRRGTGMAVASRSEATEVGKLRSFRAIDDDLRRVPELLVDFLLLTPNPWRTGVILVPRFGGITTGLVCVVAESSTSAMVGRCRPAVSGPVYTTPAEGEVVDEVFSSFSSCLVVLGGGTELKRKALGTIIFRQDGKGKILEISQA